MLNQINQVHFRKRAVSVIVATGIPPATPGGALLSSVPENEHSPSKTCRAEKGEKRRGKSGTELRRRGSGGWWRLEMVVAAGFPS